MRHGINRLEKSDGQLSARKKFKTYPIGYFHIDLTEVRTSEGKLSLFVAIDRTSKFTFARLVSRTNRAAAADFLRELIRTVPYKIHTVLTDNGTHFTTPGNSCSAPRTSNWPGNVVNFSVLTPLNWPALIMAPTTA